MAIWTRSSCYSDRNRTVSIGDISKAITELKKDDDYEWLNEVPATIITQSLRDSDTAYKNFFSGRSKFPRYKRRGNSQSCRFQMDQRILNYVPFEMFKLPVVGNLNIQWPTNVKGRPKMATIRRMPDGKYWMSFMTEQEITPHQPTGNAVGLDVGIKSLIATSEGATALLPEKIKLLEVKITRAQRKLARRIKGSGRWHRQRKAIARLHVKITNSRNDFLHKLSSELVEKYDIICAEDLNIKGMLRNHKLARAIARCSWGRFLEMLKYKCQWHNKQFVQISRWFPSTKMCNACGTINGLSLADRQLRCDCGNNTDRDINAAMNILAEGIRSLNVEGSASVVGAFGHPQQVGPMKRQPICDSDKAGAAVG